MAKEDNYHQEALFLCWDSDQNVSRIAKVINEEISKKHRRDGLSPEPGFNILYLFQAAIRLWLSGHPGIALEAATHFPLPCQPVHGVNWLASTGSAQGESAVVRDFVKLVVADSTPGGDNFDVAFAAELITATLDSDWNLRHAPPPPPSNSLDEDEEAFEEWLSGFNTPPADGPATGGAP